jgi:ATP-dependent DNA ligase
MSPSTQRWPIRKRKCRDSGQIGEVQRRRDGAERSLPRYEPCLPRPAKQQPSGPGWIHEIKHDGFRIIAYRDGDSVRLITRKGYDFADRFPLIIDAIAALPARSCVIDGEAIACEENGLSVFCCTTSGATRL